MEMRHGALRVAILFTLGVLSSSLAFYSFDKDQLILQGASGGIYCLALSCICTIILNWKEDETFMINRWRLEKSPITCDGKFIRILKLIGVIMFCVLNVALSKTDSRGTVVAHIFGSLAGFFAGFIVLRNVKKDVWEKKWKLCCVAVCLLGLGGGVTVNIAGYRGMVGAF